MTITAHIDRQTKTIDGVTFKNTHSGQKRAYGDSFYEYEITSDMPEDHVLKVCTERVYKADLSLQRWRDEYKASPSMANHFRAHYEFLRRGEGKFFYRVTLPYAD